MESSESLEYYKLKDELGQLLKDEISRSRENERDLQEKYIGMGLKIAAAGVAAAVITFGIFGIKSFYDVQSAIKGIPKTINTVVTDEVRARFKDKDPVGEYEIIVLESTARSIAASLTAQADQARYLSLDQRMSDVVVRALNDKNILPATKLSLIDAISSRKIRSISPLIDQAVIELAERAENEKLVDQRTLLGCLNYFTTRAPERFVGEVAKIYDAGGTMSGVRLAVGRYLFALTKDTDNLAGKLEKSDDINVKYFVHISNLKVGGAKQLDPDLFKAALANALNTDSDDGVSLSDLIDHISTMDEIDDRSDIVTAMLDSIREYANSNKLTLAVDDDSINNMGFRFYTPQGKTASASIDREHFRLLIVHVTDHIRDSLQESKGEFTDPIRQALEFWFPRSDPDATAHSRKAGALSLGDVKKVRFIAPDGSETPGSSLANRAILTTLTTGGNTSVVLKWNDETGQTKSMRIKSILDLDTDSLQPYGIWDRVSDYD
jgi:hypothetical protein